MPFADLKSHFERIDAIRDEMDLFVPEGLKGAVTFRGDLAGLLVVTIVASYESCVKETMVNYASRHSQLFADHVEKNFSKLSSRIAPNDLKKYTKLFGDAVFTSFNENLNRRRKLMVSLCGKNIERQLETLLGWRHDFAHAGVRNTTIDEAVQTHRLASVVIRTFNSAFD